MRTSIQKTLTFLTISIFAITFFVSLPQTTQAAGLCHCFVDTGTASTLDSCSSQEDDAKCRAQEDPTQTAKACFFAEGQTGQCTDTENKTFADINGTCTCKAAFQEDVVLNDRTPAGCAVVQKVQKAKSPSYQCTFTAKAAPPPSQTPGAADEKELLPYDAPNLNVPIPGLKFSQLEKVKKGAPLSIPWIAQYTSAMYKFLVGVGIIIAVITMMVGGIQWMTAGGSGRVSQAKEKLQRATMGLVMLLGSYLILYTINPDILSLQALSVPTVGGIEFEAKSESNAKGSATSGSTGGSGPSVVGGGPSGGAGASAKGEMPPNNIMNDLKNNSWCKIKNPSTNKESIGGIKLNQDYFGSVDCNMGKKRSAANVQYIVLHNGRAAGSNANGQKTFDAAFGKPVYYPAYKQLSDWRKANFNKTFNASSHFTIGTDGTVYQTLDVLRAGRHAVGHNSKSIGIDLIYQKKGGKITYTEEQYLAVAKLSKHLSGAYGFPMNDDTVRGHGECQKNRSDAQLDFEKMGKLVGKTFDNKKHGRTQADTPNYSAAFSESCKKVP